jgi:predicted phage baseplate assembly protein
MTEEGYLRVVFGDGVNGRRLPTGENNVRIAWRMGSGAAGNLEAGTLKKPAHPHPRVEAIDQPFKCAGGNDMESVASLRRSAPASLTTMERVVSVNDFAERAASHSSVWDARAELKSSSGRERVVCVTVVPAHGDELSALLSEDIKAFLLSRAIPGVHIELKNYVSKELKLDVTLSGNSARFDVSVVEEEVRKTLLQRFTLKNRAIGAPVYLSDVYQGVEAVRGVEYSVCHFIIEGKISNKQSLASESPDEVFHMEDESCIQLAREEAQK